MKSRNQSYIRNRAAEPSTYAGIGALGALITPFIPPQYQAIAAAVAGLAGAVATFKRDPGATDHSDNSFTP